MVKIMLCGIFENELLPGSYFWMNHLDEYETKEAKYFVYDSNDYHKCIKSALYDDMTGYVDQLQDEEVCLSEKELYVVLYNKFDGSSWGLFQKVDFGVTKEEIIENVKNQRYVEGASYFTMGHMFYATRLTMERLLNGEKI